MFAKYLQGACDQLEDWLLSTYSYLPMVDYPFVANFLAHQEHPMIHTCFHQNAFHVLPIVKVSILESFAWQMLHRSK
jgi:hypothetical protein